jgi:hypothetical protein
MALDGCFIGACTTAEEELVLAGMVLEAALREGSGGCWLFIHTACSYSALLRAALVARCPWPAVTYTSHRIPWHPVP